MAENKERKGIMINISRKPSAILFTKYEKAYKELLKGTFTEDAKSYKKLIESTIYWDRCEFDKTHKILEELLEKCTCTKDYMGVYTVKAMCYAREGRHEPLVDVYHKMLQYDITNSQTWSNLGWIYMKMGRTKEAHDAFSNAIEYDPQNPLAYNNMATYFLKTADLQRALQYALKTIELAPDLYQPLSTAALASKLLGDEEGAEKYCKQYARKGGDKKKLKAALASVSTT